MKKLTKKEKEQRLYDYYKKQHDKFKTKYGYNLTRKLSKKDFLEAYKDYKEAGSYQVVSDIIRDQRDVTEKQASTWAKNLKRNVKKWKKLAPDELTELQSELIYMTPENSSSQPSAPSAMSTATHWDLWTCMTRMPKQEENRTVYGGPLP